MNYFLKKGEMFQVDMKDRRRVYIWLDRLTGAKVFSVGTCDIEAGSQNKLGQHEQETEVMFFYAGRGTAIIGEKSYPIEPETMMFCPPGTPHQIKNTDNERLSFIWFYIPGGPEQHLRSSQ
jgi:mannose-6-phosphate isomerase-like protein (cupin superfamily)